MVKEGKEVGKRGTKGTKKAGKRTKGGEENSNRGLNKRGRRTRKEHMQTLINTYMAGNPPEVRAQIAEWERELNDNITNQDIETEEWEIMVKDLGNTRGRHMLFWQTIQQYWVMKNIVAQAMTLYKEEEVQEEARTTEPSMKDLHR